VIQYILYFKKAIDEGNVTEIKSIGPKFSSYVLCSTKHLLVCYEHGFQDLNDRFFGENMWPTETVVERIVGPGIAAKACEALWACAINPLTTTDSRLFLILYKELFFREVYTRMSRGPTLGHRYDSYMNYQELFSEVLNQSTNRPVDLQLPVKLLRQHSLLTSTIRCFLV